MNLTMDGGGPRRRPMNLAMDGGALYVADVLNDRAQAWRPAE